MSWFRRKKRRPTEKFNVLKITFVCEQDGIPERNLKQKFIPLFEERAYIRSAYLARVTYDNPNEINIALCIRMDQKDDEMLKKAIGDIFWHTFNEKEHLDTICISNEQEEELKQVCRPFY